MHNGLYCFNIYADIKQRYNTKVSYTQLTVAIFAYIENCNNYSFQYDLKIEKQIFMRLVNG